MEQAGFSPGYQVFASYLLHILPLTFYMLLLSIYGFSSDLHLSRSRVNCMLEIVSEVTRHAGHKEAGHCEVPTIYMITSICDVQYSCLHIIKKIPCILGVCGSTRRFRIKDSKNCLTSRLFPIRI
jgi:hypothetical protein